MVEKASLCVVVVMRQRKAVDLEVSLQAVEGELSEEAFVVVGDEVVGEELKVVSGGGGEWWWWGVGGLPTLP